MVLRHGLSELYAPPPDKATTALIVFVHGLFGHPYETWTWKSSKRTKSPSPSGRRPSSTNEGQSRDSGRFSQQVPETGKHGAKKDAIYWPQDLLPWVVPDIRIYTWGYDADLNNFSTASRNTIHQHAGNLLSDLVNLRAEPEVGQQPIIFVVHSLGGIIVKAALNLSKSTEGTSVKDIAPATSGICFLGTPHRGSQSASIGKIAFQITKAAGSRPNTKILQGLERNSENLDIIGDNFSQTLEKFERLRIHSFREEKLTKKKWFFVSTMVVDTDSAKIGHPHEGSGSIPANHSNMTKFESTDDVGFKRVSALLRRWVGEHRDVLAPGEDESDCIDSLTAEITKLRMRQINDADAKTFHWLFDPEVVSFGTWLQQDVAMSSPVYWIQGKPGSGKSTLMKFAIKDSRTWQLLTEAEGSNWTCASYFFHDRGSAMQKSIFGMLQEVTGSLLTQHPELFFCVEPEYNGLVRAQRTRSPTWDLDSLKSALSCIVEQRKVPIRVVLFLDALDEHDGDNDTLALFLKSLCQKADNNCVILKICLASRSWSVFQHYFSREWGFYIHEHTHTDIKIYTNSQLKSSIEEDPTLLSLERLNMLSWQITTRASGVFIWVRLVVDQLAKDIRDGTSFSMLERRVAQMPQELKQLYADILRRLNPAYLSEAYIMLQMAVSTREPLELRTFLSAVNLVMANEKFFDRIQPHPPSKINDIEDMNDTDAICLRRLASRSGGLLETYTTTVNEPSIPRFELSLSFSSKDTRLDADINEPSILCSGSLLSSLSNDTRPHATRQVVQFLHATAKEYIQEHRLSLFKDSLEPNGFTGLTGYDLLFFCSTSSKPLVSTIVNDFFYYAKMAELESPVTKDIYDQAKVAELGASDPLYTGSSRRTSIKHIWKYILNFENPESGDSLDQIFSSEEGAFYREIIESGHASYSPLILAVAANLKNLVEDIYSEYPEPRADNTARFCLLQIAAAGPDLVPIEYQDRLGMIKLLVSSGYPIDHKANLCISAKTPRKDGVRKNVNFTALKAILTGRIQSDYSEAKRLEIAECLLSQGANPDGVLVRIGYGGFPSLLGYCVQYESVAYVRLLLRYGANVKRTPDRHDLMPSQWAAIRQDKAIIQALKEYGGDSLRPDWPLDLIPEDEDAVKRAMLCTSVCGAIGHPALTFGCTNALWYNESDLNYYS